MRRTTGTITLWIMAGVAWVGLEVVQQSGHVVLAGASTEKGACCQPDLAVPCHDLVTDSNCASLGGTFYVGSSCNDIVCPNPPALTDTGVAANFFFRFYVDGSADVSRILAYAGCDESLCTYQLIPPLPGRLTRVLVSGNAVVVPNGDQPGGTYKIFRTFDDGTTESHQWAYEGQGCNSEPSLLCAGTVMLGASSASACTSDTNFDHVVDVDDLTNVILDWGECRGP